MDRSPGRSRPDQAGLIEASPEPVSQHAQLRVELTDNALRITQRQPIAWQTQPGIAFLSAGQGTVDFEGAPRNWLLGRRTAVGDNAESDGDSLEQTGPLVGIQGTLSGRAQRGTTMTLLSSPKSARAALQMNVEAPGADSVVLTAGIANGETVRPRRAVPAAGSHRIDHPDPAREQGVGRGEQP